MEKWKPIKGYEGLYDVSDCGRVRSYRKMVRGRAVVCKRPQRLLTPYSNGNGYLFIHLYKDGVFQHYYIHTLVLLAFVGTPEPDKECCHKDNNKANNAADNLC